MATQYDPSVIQEFADRLYSKANGIIRSYTLLGIIILGFAGLATGEPILGAVGAVIGAVIGCSMGKEKAFSHKLQAQTALCQVQTEVNSRNNGTTV